MLGRCFLVFVGFFVPRSEANDEFDFIQLGDQRMCGSLVDRIAALRRLEGSQGGRVAKGRYCDLQLADQCL